MAKSVTKTQKLFKKVRDPKTGKKMQKQIGTKTTVTNAQKGSNVGFKSDNAKLKSQQIKADKDVRLARQANIANVATQIGSASRNLIGSNSSSQSSNIEQMVNGGAQQSASSRDDDPISDDPFIYG